GALEVADQRLPRRPRRQTATPPARAHGTVVGDADVADVAGRAVGPLERVPAIDDAGTDAGRVLDGEQRAPRPQHARLAARDRACVVLDAGRPAPALASGRAACRGAGAGWAQGG